jgi:hypothetical protein
MFMSKWKYPVALLLLAGIAVAANSIAQNAFAQEKPAAAPADPKEVKKPSKDVKGASTPSGSKPVKPPEPQVNHPQRDPLAIAAAIDRELDQRLSEAKVPASPRADDAEFLRRVCLDITGRIPTLDRATTFLASTDPEKRRKLIDDLLASREYGQHLGTLWRNLLAPRDLSSAKTQAETFTPWLEGHFNRNQGWDRIVYELLTAEGDVRGNPQTAFILANGENLQPQANLLAASSARLFLGVQLQCAECHNHPFTSWKQADFWSTAAFFGRVRNVTKGGPQGITEAPPTGGQVQQGGNKGESTVEIPPGAIRIPSASGKNAGQVVQARFLDGTAPALDNEGPYRPRFAAWVIAPQNPYFANALVNRMWAQFFGRGIVHPVDNFHADNPPAHPAVLKQLADEFRASEYDLKHLVRCLCNSQAYQRTSRPLPGNENDTTLVSRMAVKPITPEVFYDSLAQVVNIDQALATAAPRPSSKGKQMPANPRDQFIRAFTTQSDSSETGEFNHGIPQFLRRMNTEAFNSGSPLIARLVKYRATQEQVIESLYLATLSRRPTTNELRLMSDYLGKRSSPEQGYAGVLWILLNSGEFVLNH